VKCRMRVPTKSRGETTLYANQIGPTDIGVTNAGLGAMWSILCIPQKLTRSLEPRLSRI
jgi:hypothetical protein